MSPNEPDCVLLISCYELGHQPLGIAWPFAYLKKAGFRPAVMDLAIESLDEAKIRRAQLIAISVPMHTALRMGVKAARRIRQLNPDCHIAFFGLYAHLNADYLKAAVADSILKGDPEGALVSLAEALSSNGKTKFLKPAPKRKPKPPSLVPNRDSLPGLERYARLEYDGRELLAGHVEATRGCKHLCLHCPLPPVFNGRFTAIPKEIVLRDIRNQVRAGARHITFGDPDFLNGPTHSLAIVRKMHEEFPDLTFDFTAKIEHIVTHPAIFAELACAGCLFVISAAESTSEEVLSQLQKGHSRRDLYLAHQILREAGIAFRPCWVAFTPWTTLSDYLDMLDFCEREGLIFHVDPVQFSIRLLIPPGSDLLTKGNVKPFLKGLDAKNFCWRWIHPDPRMDELAQQIARVMEDAVRKEEDPVLTFAKIKQRALAAKGEEEAVAVCPAPGADKRGPPRLTEAWFCCAEPTSVQINF